MCVFVDLQLTRVYVIRAARVRLVSNDLCIGLHFAHTCIMLYVGVAALVVYYKLNARSTPELITVS